MKLQPYWDKEWLRKQYIEKKLSCEEIALICKVSRRTIQRYLKKYGFVTQNKKKEKKQQNARTYQKNVFTGLA